jgi:hypothetical protein
MNLNFVYSLWRPLVGYVALIGIGIQFVVFPLAILCGHAPLAPLDTTQLIALTTTLLGMGGLRTYEKLNNVTGNH